MHGGFFKRPHCHQAPFLWFELLECALTCGADAAGTGGLGTFLFPWISLNARFCWWRRAGRVAEAETAGGWMMSRALCATIWFLHGAAVKWWQQENSQLGSLLPGGVGKGQGTESLQQLSDHLGYLLSEYGIKNKLLSFSQPTCAVPPEHQGWTMKKSHLSQFHLNNCYYYSIITFQRFWTGTLGPEAKFMETISF